MSTTAPVLIRELTPTEQLCTTCDVPGGCDDGHPFCAYELDRLQIKVGQLERQLRDKQRRGDVLRYLMAEGEAESTHFATLWDADQRYISHRIMGPLRDGGYIERVNGDGPWARWRLADGNATGASI